jgi:hypothetical protein
MTMYVLLNDERGQLALIQASVRCQLVARLHADRLDRELARGGSPQSGRRLAVRAMQLTSPRMRRLLSGSLRRVASGRGSRISVVSRSAAAESAAQLQELADVLAAPEPAPVRGIAMVRMLLTDSTGPLYPPHRPDELAAVIRQAAKALEASGTAVAYRW